MEATPALVPSPSVVPPAAAAVRPSPVMGVLGGGVPLTLLLDLAFGVRSREVYEDEAADLSWLPEVVASAG